MSELVFRLPDRSLGSFQMSMNLVASPLELRGKVAVAVLCLADCKFARFFLGQAQTSMHQGLLLKPEDLLLSSRKARFPSDSVHAYPVTSHDAKTVENRVRLSSATRYKSARPPAAMKGALIKNTGI